MSIVEVKPSYTISDRYSMLPLAGIQVKDCSRVISNEVKTNRLTNEETRSCRRSIKYVEKSVYKNVNIDEPTYNKITSFENCDDVFNESSSVICENTYKTINILNVYDEVYN